MTLLHTENLEDRKNALREMSMAQRVKGNDSEESLRLAKEVCIFACVYVCMYICPCVYMYVYMPVWMYVCVLFKFVFISLHVHT
jgi:hypothetical protein